MEIDRDEPETSITDSIFASENIKLLIILIGSIDVDSTSIFNDESEKSGCLLNESIGNLVILLIYIYIYSQRFEWAWI